MKSKRSGRDLLFIKIKCDNPKQAEALLSGGGGGGSGGTHMPENIHNQFWVEEFRTTLSIQQCFKCQGFGHKASNCTKNQKCVVCGEAHSHKNCPNKEKRKPKCANCRGPMSPTTEAVLLTRQAFRQYVVQKQVSYTSILKRASPPPPNNTFNFTAEQIVSLVTNVVIQIAQPQLCTINVPEKQVQAKSDLSKQIAETAKKCLGVNIEGKDVFESTISRPAPPPQAPFIFSSTLVEKKKAPLNASTVLNKVTPPLATSSNSTKFTKTPSQGSQRKSSSKLSPQQNKALAIKIELQNGDKVILATIYCPNGNPSLRLFRMINAFLNQVIFLRDFNSKHKQFGCVKPSKSGQTLVNIAKDLKLFYANQLGPNRHTRKDPVHASSNVLDMAFLSPGLSS